MLELRIPWGLLNITDPSSKSILWFDHLTKTRETDGIGIIAASYKPKDRRFNAQITGQANNVTDSLPQKLTPENIARYSWERWEIPIYHTYLKENCKTFKNYLRKIPEGVTA
jgi:hypothetical protein